jgi:hypothetical protein
LRLASFVQFLAAIETLRPALTLTAGISESLTVTVKGKTPVAVGVPESTPVFGSMESHAGLPLMLQVYGVTPPLAVTVAL